MRPTRRTTTARVDGYRRAPAVTIRWATPADARSLAMLAELDEVGIPPTPHLLGFVGEELWVALSLSTGEVISDPFRPSAEVAALIRERGRQLTAAELGRPRSGVMRFAHRLRVPRRFEAPNPARLSVSGTRPRD